jgi:predicted DNA-binding WGR domain protein
LTRSQGKKDDLVERLKAALGGATAGEAKKEEEEEEAPAPKKTKRAAASTLSLLSSVLTPLKPRERPQLRRRRKKRRRRRPSQLLLLRPLPPLQRKQRRAVLSPRWTSTATPEESRCMRVRFFHYSNSLTHQLKTPCSPLYSVMLTLFSSDYDCMLNQTNISQNNNKYYVIQLLVGAGRYYVFNRWGRVGEPGQQATKGPFGAVDPAKKEFEKK